MVALPLRKQARRSGGGFPPVLHSLAPVEDCIRIHSCDTSVPLSASASLLAHGLGRALVALQLAALAGVALAQPAPLSVDALQQARWTSPWIAVRQLPDGPGFSARLVAYRSSGLLVHALVATPAGPAPETGFPVLVANHGFHPDPPRYGITAAGLDLRPGDYYRPVPALYTRAGFIVVMPDYRGHNSSEGLAFTRSPTAPASYTEDVLALLPGLDSLEHADLRHVFAWGHSMGVDVTLRALLSSRRFRGAALWSGSLSAPALLELTAHLPALTTPLVIQHAVADPTTGHAGSVQLAAALQRAGLPHEFHSVPGADHFFQGRALQQAVDRDVRFFRSLMQPAALPTPSR